MPALPAGSPRFRHWFRRFGRALVLVTQLVAAVAPVAEAHEEQVLSAHVEAPRTVPHPGHHADACPACMLLSVHGCPSELPQLEELEPERIVVPRVAASHAVAVARVFSNSSRAPPLCS
jgi:hypothetical protein